MKTSFLSRYPLIVVVALSLVACGGGGGGSNGGGSSNPQFPNMAGNWDVLGTSQVSTGATFEAGGAFAQSGGTLSGTIRMLDSCYDINVAIALSGTVTSGGAVNLSATAPDGGQIKVTGNVTPDGGTMTAAQYTVTGGCATGDHGTLQANRMAPVTGTFTGSFHSSVNSSTTAVTANLTQTANSTGNLGGTPFTGTTAVSGTVQLPSGVCFTSGTSQEGFVIGSLFYALLNTSNGQVQVIGDVSPDGRHIANIDYEVIGGTCDGDSGTGKLDR